MDWFFSIIRIAGVAFPGAAALVQLQAEIDSVSLKKRVSKLEDPISWLHDDVPELSRHLYRKLKAENSLKLRFDDDFYTEHSRALAVLETRGHLKGSHALGKRFAEGLWVTDPSYVMYMCVLEEDDAKMGAIIKAVEDCQVGKWLDGKVLQTSIGLPLPVIKAVFDIYEGKGYGLCSKTIGVYEYLGIA